MKKKSTAQPSISSTEGFTVESAPSTTVPPTTTVTPPTSFSAISPSAPPPIPAIDKNADLKIETVETPTIEEIPSEEKHGKLIFILGTVVGLLIVAGVISFSLIYYTTPPVQKPVAVIETTIAPTITEAPKKILKNEEISFEVLNATKTSGQAAKYSKKIESLGFKVRTTGNSEEKVTGLNFYFSKALDSQKEQLITDLKKEFPNAIYTGSIPDSTNQVRLIIGN